MPASSMTRCISLTLLTDAFTASAISTLPFGHTEATVLSGTNTDDLGDYRPGLKAAEAASVIHPYIEALIDKATIRSIASNLGLNDLAELPASPCLSSRVETGNPINARWLGVIEKVEKDLALELSPGTVRCLLREDQVVVELDSATLRNHNDREEVFAFHDGDEPCWV